MLDDYQLISSISLTKMSITTTCQFFKDFQYQMQQKERLSVMFQHVYAPPSSQFLFHE